MQVEVGMGDRGACGGTVDTGDEMTFAVYRIVLCGIRIA
jgi:hypothetical protein